MYTQPDQKSINRFVKDLGFRPSDILNQDIQKLLEISRKYGKKKWVDTCAIYGLLPTDLTAYLETYEQEEKDRRHSRFNNGTPGSKRAIKRAALQKKKQRRPRRQT